MSIEKITSLLESLFIFWIIVSKHSMNIISLTLSSKNHMYCHVWCLNVNVKNFKFNLHCFNSAQIWLRFCLDLTQTFCLNLTQMWLRCVLISSCIIMLKCVSSCLILQTSCSDLTQMWLRFILVLSVLHYIKMHSYQFLSHFNLHLQFFLISSCFFSSFCKSSVLKREVTVMMSNH